MSFPLAAAVDDRDERHQANRAVAVSAAGLALTGLVELVIALVSGSVALLGDALHNLSDVSTSLLVFVGFRASRRAATPRYPYGYERAEDLAGVGVAAVIWASAAVAGTESVAKLVHHGTTQHLGWGIAAAAAGILGNQLVARYKLAVGRRIQSATMIADAKHSWLDALVSSKPRLRGMPTACWLCNLAKVSLWGARSGLKNGVVVALRRRRAMVLRGRNLAGRWGRVRALHCCRRWCLAEHAD